MGNKQFSQKQKLKVLESSERIGIKEAAEISDVHYTTVYDWKRKLDSLGRKNFLAYKSSHPGRGIKEISPKQEEVILTTWRRNLGFGPGQVRNQLRRQGITISIRTVRKVMEANGYEASGKRNKDRECGNNFEASRPLELVQMDILEFYINKLKIYLLVLLDDFSRFILGFRLLCETSVDEVIDFVEEAKGQYGKAEEVLTDRGFVFYSWKGINRFERYLEIEGIDHTHASAHHPKTLGKIEALNGRIRRELLECKHFSSLGEARAIFTSWVYHYNYKRTHQGLGGLLVPADRFHGLTSLVLTNLGNHIDMGDAHWYTLRGIERSIINISVNTEGKLTFYLLGQPIDLGGINGRTIES